MDLAASVSSVPPAVAIPVAGVLAVCMLAWADAKRLTSKPKLSYQSTKFNEGILSRIPTLRSLYKPLPFLTNGHVETIFAAKARRKVDVEYRRENLHMPDGGVVSLDWRVPKEGDLPLADDAPVLILLPGLTGGSDDSYVRYAVHYAESHGTRAVVFNSRGCGDTFLTTPRFYSGLYIGDMQRVADAVRLRYPRSQLFAAGWSLGANILVNYLGLVGEDTPIDGAAAMCNPFDLTLGSQNLQKGFNKVYSRNLGGAMSRIMQRNRKVWNGVGGDFDVERACNAPSVWAWDDAITRVSFGFKSVEQYYAAAGSHQRVHGVKVPLLVIQAADDPIAPIAGTPVKALEDNPNCILAVTKTGGHLGWVSGGGGYFGEPWTDRVLTEWLLSVQVQTANDAARSLLGSAGSQLPKTPQNYSIASGLAGSNGDGSVSSVGSAAVGQGAVLDPALTRTAVIAQPFDGVHLSPSQTGYDPAERQNYSKHATRQPSAMRASTAASARPTPQQQLTPPRLRDAGAASEAQDDGNAETVAEAKAPQSAVEAPRRAAAERGEEPRAGDMPAPPPAAVETPASAPMEASDQGTQQRGGNGTGAPSCSAPEQALPLAAFERAANGAMRVAVPQGGGAQGRTPAPSTGHGEGPAGPAGGSSITRPAAMPLGTVRDAGGAARLAPGLTPPRPAPVDHTASASSSLPAREAGLSEDEPPKVVAAPQHGGSGAVGSATSGLGRGEEAAHLPAAGVMGGSGRRAQVCVGEEEGSSEQTGVGEARMRAGRAVATFVQASRDDAVFNEAWQEGVGFELPGGSRASGSESVQARAELLQSLLANNAEALDAIAKGAAGLPLHAGKDGSQPDEASPAGVPAVVPRGASGSMARSEAARSEAGVDGTPVDRRPVPAQGFFVDVDPSEYAGLHRGFDSGVRSRPARSVGSQSASSQGVWWNRP